MHKLLITLLCVACAAANEISDSVDYDPRFLLFNKTGLFGDDDAGAVLALVGGIVGLVALGLLIWLAVSLLFPSFDEYGTGYTGTGYTSGHSGYQAR